MTPEAAQDILRHALEIIVLISAPIMIGEIIIGVVVGMIQAATQIQETSLSFIPKLVMLALVLVLSGPWILKVLVDYTLRLYGGLPGILD